MTRKHRKCVSDLYWGLSLKYGLENTENDLQDHSPSLWWRAYRDHGTRLHGEEQLTSLCLLTFDQRRSFYDTL